EVGTAARMGRPATAEEDEGRTGAGAGRLPRSGPNGGATRPGRSPVRLREGLACSFGKQSLRRTLRRGSSGVQMDSARSCKKQVPLESKERMQTRETRT